jgi:Annexin
MSEKIQTLRQLLPALPSILIIYAGIIHEPFVRIFSTMNKAQFDSINEEYKGKRLLKDITSKMGGNFETLVLAMCADKYEYMAKRLHKLLAGSSVNREGICRYTSA